MKIFLVIYMLGSDELLIKETQTVQECLVIQKQMKKAFKHNKEIEKIECESGLIVKQFTSQNEDMI